MYGNISGDQSQDGANASGKSAIGEADGQSYGTLGNEAGWKYSHSIDRNVSSNPTIWALKWGEGDGTEEPDGEGDGEQSEYISKVGAGHAMEEVGGEGNGEGA